MGASQSTQGFPAAAVDVAFGRRPMRNRGATAEYQQLVEKAQQCHEQGRRTDTIEAVEVDLARLYAYAFRIHTIGSFYATGKALKSHPAENELTRAHVQRAIEQLDDLANQGMEPVPDDFRAVLSSFYRYHRGVERVVDALSQAQSASGNRSLSPVAENFAAAMSKIQSGNGIYLTQDTGASEQASFVVPNLGITIVPLVYGDHHSWNLAYLTPENLDVPNHRHRFGVEIHLGYKPIEGYMVLGDSKAPVTEGYALPVPPMTRHGWINTFGETHHVPFIFGSLMHAGWGVFMDVEPRPIPVDDLETVDRGHWKMGPAIFLEREIANFSSSMASQRSILIPAAVMDRNGSGGLELAIARANPAGFSYPTDHYRAASVVRGNGILEMGPVACEIRPHDHFGVPAGMTASMRQVGEEPLVVLDALIRTF